MRLRAGLGVQDADRPGRPRAGHDHADEHRRRHRLPVARRRPRPGSTTRTSGRWATSRSRTSLAYSRNVVAARVALGPGPDDQRRGRDPQGDLDAARASASRPGSTSPARPRASSTTRRSSPGTRSTSPTASFGQGVAVTLVQLATAYAAMVNGGHPGPRPTSSPSIGNQPVPATPGPQVISPDHLGHPDQPDVVRRPHGALVRGRHPGQGLHDRGQDGHGPDLGPAANHGRGAWQHDTATTTRSSATSARTRPGPGHRDRDPRGQAARSSGRATCPCAVESYELFRRIATDSMKMPDLIRPAPGLDQPARGQPDPGRCGPSPTVTGRGACHTGRRDRPARPAARARVVRRRRARAA